MQCNERFTFVNLVFNYDTLSVYVTPTRDDQHFSSIIAALIPSYLIPDSEKGVIRQYTLQFSAIRHGI